MAAPHLDIKTILTTNSGQVWAPVGGTTLRPDPPTIAPSVITTTTVTVTLSPGSGLTSRIPYRDGTALTAVAGDVTSYQFTGLTASTAYTLSFVDEKNGRLSASSLSLPVTTATPPIIVPAAPVLTFVSKDSSSITVNSTGSANATSYIPVRSGTPLAEITLPQLPYKFTGLAASTPYTLTLRAKSSAGTSGDSNPITQTTDAAVTTLTVPMRVAAYGGTDFADQAEIARRAKFEWIVFQGWYSMSASMLQTHINAIRTINPTIKVYLYLMLEGIGDGDDLGNFLDANNLWARDVYPAGTRQSVWTGTHGTNLGSPRTVGGFTCGEALVNLHRVKNAAVWALVDGIMLDNMWYATGYDLDVNEDGVKDSQNSTGVRNAFAGAYQKVYALLKSFNPAWKIGCNPRAPVQLLSGIDDAAAFRSQRWDFFMNQNAGPGMYFNGEAVFPYDGGITDFTKYRLWPSEAAIVGTPAHGQLLMRASIGGFLPTTTRPQANPTLGDTLIDLQTGNWISDIQNILMETKGFTETEEVTYGAFAAQHNRVCLAYWYVLSDLTPYLYGTDTAGTGRVVVHPYQDYFKGMPWVDAAPAITAPYFTSGVLKVYHRRIGGVNAGDWLLCPRAERGQAATAPATITCPTPPLPPGKSVYRYFDGTTVGSTVTLGHRDGLGIKAF